MRVILSSDRDKFFEPKAELTELNPTERMKLSLQKFFLFFFLAVGSVLIPVLHFFLVPLFLVLSVVFAMKTYAIRYRFRFLQPRNCLQCEQPLKSEIRMDENLRMKCENCFAQYVVDEKK